MVLYIFCAIAVVLVAGWAVYVLPAPGDLSAWELAGAFLPAVLLLAGVIAVLLSFWLVLHLARLGFGLIHRRRRR